MCAVVILVAGGVEKTIAANYVESIRHCADVISLKRQNLDLMGHSASRSDHGENSRAELKFIRQQFCFCMYVVL